MCRYWLFVISCYWLFAISCYWLLVLLPSLATANDLGFNITDDMRIDAHEKDTCHKDYIDIRRINSVRHLLSIDATKTMLSALCFQNYIIVILFSLVDQCYCWKDFRRFKTVQQD